MPIKGITDRGASFPQIGVLRKGAPKPDRGPGKDLNHFRLDTQYKDVSDVFRDAYGDEPQSLNVFLPYATPKENFSAWQEEYRAGGLVHRCDGETMALWLTPQGTYSQEPKPCPYHTGEKKRTPKNPGCKPVGRLQVIIPELKRFAYVMALTTSVHDIMELQANLNAAFAMRGDLRGIPFILSRRPKMISTPSGANGKRARREKWLLFLEPSPEWVALQIEEMQRKALIQPRRDIERIAALPAVDMSDALPALPQPATFVDAEPVYHTGAEPVDEDLAAIKKDSAANMAASTPMITKQQLKALHARGREFYGDEWDTVRHDTLESKGLKSSNDLNRDQATSWSNWLAKKIKAKADEAALAEARAA